VPSFVSKGIKKAAGSRKKTPSTFLGKGVQRAAAQPRPNVADQNMANRYAGRAAYQWATQQMADPGLSVQDILPPLSFGGGGGSGGGGGGGPEFIDYYARYEPYRQELRAKLDELRGAVPAALDRYLGDFNTRVGTINSQNQALTGQYQAAINSLLERLVQESQGAQAGLMGDLAAQGADTRALGAQFAADASTARQIATEGDLYNQRLAQLQAMAAADRQAMGAAIDQSARAQLENEYVRQLAAIGMLGL
jgi:hypothetical protein